MTPCSVEGVKARLDALSIKPNRVLGQNFLTDIRLRDEALDHAPIMGANVLEIGPGLGALTEGLLNAGARKIVAVEKDECLYEHLKKEYADESRLVLLNEDILSVSLDGINDILGNNGFYVAASLPYYITSAIALMLLNSGIMISGMTLIVQQEAAERFFASPGDEVYGPLAVASKRMYSAKKTVLLPPSSFYPQPRVHSAALTLTRTTDELNQGFTDFLKSAFAMRRKTLMNNLMAIGMERERIKRLLGALNIREDIRAEALESDMLHAIWRFLYE